MDDEMPWRIFEPVDTGGPLPWYTWSKRARSILERFAETTPELEKPKQIRVKGAGLYAVTWTLSEHPIRDRTLSKEIDLLANALFRFSLPPSGLILLRDLFGKKIDGEVIFLLFALLRGLLSKRAPAFHAPIEAVPVLRSGFPLHADLFPVSTLLTIFDRVPTAGSASILMPFRQFVEILENLQTMPKVVKGKIKKLIQGREGDGYDELIHLLYHRRHSWQKELDQVLKRKQRRIDLHGGEGYMLNDRAWLHGREMQAKPVPFDRLQRLVFQSEKSG
ncbi:MAG: hypothetical protein QNK37_33215 [Acidobacteriota bacterium]|nr:hypothetical protein [Acidobacteriota bacterium]